MSRCSVPCRRATSSTAALTACIRRASGRASAPGRPNICPGSGSRMVSTCAPASRSPATVSTRFDSTLFDSTVHGEEAAHGGVPVVALGAGPGRGPPDPFRPGQQRAYPGREILARHAGPRVAHHLGQRGLRAHHHRGPAGQRLERGQPEGLRRPGRDGHVGAGQQRGQLGAPGQEAGEGDRQPGPRRPAPQPRPQRAAARHHQPDGHALGAQGGQRGQRPLRLLLRRQPPAVHQQRLPLADVPRPDAPAPGAGENVARSTPSGTRARLAAPIRSNSAAAQPVVQMTRW